MKLSSLLSRFEEPATLKMAQLGRALRAEGIAVTDLSLGEPDFDTPAHIKEAAKKAIDENYSHYTPVGGFLELKEAICRKFKNDNNLDYLPENIVASTGAKQCIANVVLALVDNDDEVIIPAPFWVTYSEIVKLAGGKVISIATTAATDYKINADDLRKVINEKTKLFMFSSPCNPSGALYLEKELAALVKVFEEFPNVWILSDEIYEHINYTGKHHTIASFPGMKDRTIVVNGLSKSFAMTGWRLGYMAAIAPIAKACEKLQGQFTSAPNSITQRAAIAALDGGLGSTIEMVSAFKKRRDRILELLGEIDGIKFNTPASAFYVFPEVSALFEKKTPNGDMIENADDLCMYLLNDAHVTTVSGSAFGSPECIRISFSNSLENIEAGMKKIKDAVAALV